MQRLREKIDQRRNQLTDAKYDRWLRRQVRFALHRLRFVTLTRGFVFGKTLGEAQGFHPTEKKR